MADTPFVELKGYAPDVPPTIPGVIVDCVAVLPSRKGFIGAPSAADFGMAALAAQCRGAASLRKRDETPRTLAGTTTKLYERADLTWTDRTGATTLNGLGGTDRWSFAQFGDTSLVTAKTEILRASTSGAFALAAANAPKAAIVETANNFVLLFDVIDQGAIYDSSERTDGWWCAAKGGYTSWTPSVSTEAATGVLQSTAGKIMGAKRFGYQVVAYKRRSMYLGTYVGQPSIWDWQLIPGDAGAVANATVVDIGTEEEPRHLFMGADNFYQFDGGRATPIGYEVKETVFGSFESASFFAAFAVHDSVNSRVFFYYPTTSSGISDKCVVYNYDTRRWGRDDRQAEAGLNMLPPSLTYDGLGALYSTYDDLPDGSYDLAFSASGVGLPAIFDTSHLLRTLDGAAGNSSFEIGDYGSDQQFSLLSRFRPRFLSAPTSATFTHRWRDTLSDTKTAEAAVALQSGRFDCRRSARWHSGELQLSGNYEIMGFTADATEDGQE